MPKYLTRSMGVRLMIPILIAIAMIMVLPRKGTRVARCTRWCRERMGAAAVEPICETHREQCASADVTYQACAPERQHLRAA